MTEEFYRAGANMTEQAGPRRLVLIIKAWNVFRSGQTATLRHLKWS